MMTSGQFEALMVNALIAYKNGYPVVVFSNAREPLHGREFLDTVADLSMPLEAFFVDGVTTELWNASEYRQALERARKRFMEGQDL